MIVSLLVLVVVIVLSLPSAMVVIPFAVVTGNVGPLYYTTCFIVRVAFRVAGIRVRVEGLENVPPGQACIFMANHMSNLDPPGLIPRIPGAPPPSPSAKSSSCPSSAIASSSANLSLSTAPAARPPRSKASQPPSAFWTRASTLPPSSKAGAQETDA